MGTLGEPVDMNRFVRITRVALVTGWLLGFQGVAQASTINIIGSSVGCFDCTSAGPFDSPTVFNGLTFTGGDFNLWTGLEGFGSAALGSLTFDSSVAFNYSSGQGQHEFLLQVVFTAPTGSGLGDYQADITGSINVRGNGDVRLNFDNAFQTFFYSTAAGSGSFDFAILSDLNFNNPAGTTQTITGSIRNATFTATTVTATDDPAAGTDDPPAGEVIPLDGGGADGTVPEPASLLLFAAGMSIGSIRLRRRFTPSSP
jgi:hypothetical protein